MPVLPEYTTPLRGIWKIEESRDELLALLTRKDDYVPFLAGCKSDTRQMIEIGRASCRERV